MRKSVLVTLLLMLLLLLAACGGASTPAPKPTEAPAAEPTEAPAAEPTEAPAAEPTEEPAAEPTEAPEDEVDAGFNTACLVTDLGNVNDGTFNEFAYTGMVDAAEAFGLETTFIETQSETDYAKNIDTCVQEGYDAVITVGFLIADATLAAAEANADTMFIGVDQFFAEPPANLVGIQYREDQGGFLAGALACMMTESGVVGGVYGVDIPPVIKFRHGFENGCAYVNPDASALGVYVPSFVDPAAGASTAEQFIGEGADVIFGAGGPTGSGGIRNAAEQGVYAIGVDQDEYNTTFGGGDAPGADKLISSAVKRVDLGVYDQLQGLSDPDSGLWAGGGLYILEAANNGITYAPFHDAADDIPDAVKARLEEIREMLASGELETGVDPISGDMMADTMPEPVPFDGTAMADSGDSGDSGDSMGGLTRACLVTDLGNVNDGTFNEFAYNGMLKAEEEFGLETTFIETQSETDYAKNIDTCVQEGYEAIITVGFLIADATLAAAEANPDTMFIGVDQFFPEPPANLVGIQYREDQGGFLAGALACMMTESGVVGGVYGIDIPPVVKFRNGFENGCGYVNPDASALGVYVPSFVDPAAGASTAEQFIGEGADVIFGAGGPTGSGGIRNAAEQGVYVIGVDQDEYNTTFGGGDAPGADKLISSAVKRVDLGVYDQLKGLVDSSSGLWSGGGLYILDAANDGITYADFHDAAGDIPDAVKTRLEEIRQMLASGDLDTGVDPISGDVLEDQIPESVPFDGEASAEASDDGSAMAESALTKACLVTDLGNVNDGTFNEFAYNGLVKAEEEFGFETTFIETQSETDYAKNIDTCVQEGYKAVITVGFLIADATLAAAEANPNTMFIGVDQFFVEPPANLVGIQYREDQGGFLAGALACMMTQSGVVGGVYGIDIPPVVKFRHGFENGCGYVNPDASALGVYVPSFVDPAAGASTAEQFIGEGADVIFGAGGPTGSGGIRNAAEQGIYVIGVDQDEYNTTFGGGDAPGADKLISSAVKRVDLGVYDQLKGLADANSELWAGGGLYILEAANDGITYADFHDAAGDIPDAVKARLEEIRQMLASGDLDTGVDPISGDILEDQIPEAVPFDGEASAGDSAMAESALTKACLVTDLGNVNDGTFNEFAYNGLVKAEEEFGFETTFIETQSETDYAKNIDTCVQEGYEAVVTVGFLIADATLAAAEANPNTMFIGVDQFFVEPPANLVGIQYREDQGGFLAGALACMMTESGVVGGVYGVDIPPVVKFRNGFENGCGYVNPDASALGVYVPSFVDPAAGASTAEQFIGEGADVIFGAGGPTGSGGIRNAAEQGIYVIGVDQDEYNTTFGGGDAPGADKLISSAVKRVDLGVYDQLKGLADPNSELWAGGGLYILEAANDGITYADFHDAEADIPDSVKTRLEEIRQALADGELDTGVDPISGDVLEDQIPEPVPFEK